MQKFSPSHRSVLPRLIWTCAFAAGLAMGLCGCATFWDDFWNHEHSYSDLWTSKDPMVVLRESSDGGERARALAALEEPMQHGGSQKDQETVLKMLELSATSDKQAICRLASLRTLGRFKDPRAAEILEAAYLQPLPFGKDEAMNGLVRQQCLSSLAETGGPVALNRLVLVAKEPPASDKAPESIKQETLQRRLAAMRGLAKFKDPQAATALAYVMKTDKDIAARDRAYESLQTCTGKSFPADSPQWAMYMQAGPQSGPQQTPPQGQVLPAGGWQGAKTQGPG